MMERAERSFGVKIESLPRWESAEVFEKDDEELKGVKFPFNEEINSKIRLWEGNITTLDIDAIVNSTNENMTDNTGIAGEIIEAAGPEIREDISKTDNCRTGESRLTKGYNLPARFVIHTVGPRYNEKYKTAAENALHSCYRNCLESLKENNLRTIAFPIVNSQKRGYPPEAGSHIAIRTVRRFLEHWGKDIETIVFCVSNPNDFKLYSRILPLYFPRNKKEERMGKEELPRDIGNEFGETVIEERKIRIQAHPSMKPNSTVISPRPNIEESVLKTPRTYDSTIIPGSFVQMQSDFDEERKKRLEKMSKEEKEKLNQQQIYLTYLYRAQNMDLSDVARLNVIYESGKYSQN